MFLSVLVTGRSWCGVLCPMGAASEWMNGIGLKRPVPGWLRWEGTPIVSFLIVTILGQTVGVRDYPSAILEVFGGTLLAALVIGYFYGQGQKKRAWCRHACPIGLLLGVFSRLGAVDLVPKRPEAGGDAYDRRGLCPTMIDLKPQDREPPLRDVRALRARRTGRARWRCGCARRGRRSPTSSATIRRRRRSGSCSSAPASRSAGSCGWCCRSTRGCAWRSVAWAIEHGYTWLGEPGPSWLMVVHPEAREVFVWLDFFLIVGWMIGVMLALTGVLAALQAARGLARRPARRGGHASATGSSRSATRWRRRR